MAEVNLVAPTRATTLPDDPLERKKYPIATGVLDYFPDAIVAIARVSWEGNNQHNPGEPLHWARGKSMDQDDTTLRHFVQRGTLDTDGQRHLAKAAWRILAMLQLEIEEEQRAEAKDKAALRDVLAYGVITVGEIGPKPLNPCCSQATKAGFSCTRPKGHVGQHVAQYTNGQVCAVWN